MELVIAAGARLGRPFGVAPALALLLLGQAAACSSAGEGSEARDLVAAGALLLDVRTTQEFARGHLPGAVNIPVSQLAKRVSELGDRQRAVVVYCQRGTRSRMASEVLRRAGFSAVHDLGAMGRW